MEAADQYKEGLITKTTLEQVSGHDSEERSPDRSAKTDETRNCAYRGKRQDICGYSHNQSGPRLLAEESDAEQCKGKMNGDQRHEHHSGHECRAQSQRRFSRLIDTEAAAQENAGEISAKKASDARSCVWDPCMVADLFDIELARIIQVLGKPEKQEVPCRIAHELGEDQHLDNTDGEQLANGNGANRPACVSGTGAVG